MHPASGTPAAARQVLVVTSSGSAADVDLLMYTGSSGSCPRMNMVGRVGRNGVRALANRRSGDGTTPGGIFPLGSMTAPDGQTFQFFGNGVNPGVRGTWRQVKAGDCWGATPEHGRLQHARHPHGGQLHEPRRVPRQLPEAYSRAALIGANMGPNRSGDAAGEPALAAAIFLHRHSYDANGNSKPTSGCVSLNNTDLIYVLQRLRPRPGLLRHPVARWRVQRAGSGSFLDLGGQLPESGPNAAQISIGPQAAQIAPIVQSGRITKPVRSFGVKNVDFGGISTPSRAVRSISATLTGRMRTAAAARPGSTAASTSSRPC